VDSDYDVKTRVTGLEQLKIGQSGQGCLVVIHAPLHADLGRLHTLAKEIITIGRGRDNDIVLPSDCVSRRHSRLERRNDRVFVVDLASTNGTYVNDEAQSVRERPLERGDRLRIGDTIFKYLSGSDIEVQYHEILFRMTVTDGLTNLSNRKQLDATLREEIPRARRHNRDLSVLMLDIDHFKQINDTHGHPIGDRVLLCVAQWIAKGVRQTDVVARYGGEEFAVLLPNASASEVEARFKGLVADIASSCYEYDVLSRKEQVWFTVSCGLVDIVPGEAEESFVKRADDALYEAKKKGRNRVVTRKRSIIGRVLAWS